MNLAVSQGVVHLLTLRLQRRPRAPYGEGGVEHILVHADVVNSPSLESLLDVRVLELHLHVAVAHPRDDLQHALEVVQGVALYVDPGVLIGEVGGYPRHPLRVHSVHLPTDNLDPVGALPLQRLAQGHGHNLDEVDRPVPGVRPDLFGEGGVYPERFLELLDGGFAIEHLLDEDLLVRLPQGRVPSAHGVPLIVPAVHERGDRIDRIPDGVLDVTHRRDDLLVLGNLRKEVKDDGLVLVLGVGHRRGLDARVLEPPHKRRDGLQDVIVHRGHHEARLLDGRLHAQLGSVEVDVHLE